MFIKLLLLLIIYCNLSFSYKNITNIVIIADIHGDISRFNEILYDANIIDKNEQWIAEPNTLVIQLGDQIDPKYFIDDIHHFSMIYYTDILEKKAEQNNCHFISMIGNHELLNIEKIKTKNIVKSIIASRPIVKQIDNYLFCHGMFNNYQYNILQKYNKTFDDINNIWSKYVLNSQSFSIEEKILLNNLILDTENSILYKRVPDTKDDINTLFKILNVNYLFVGHTLTDHIHLKDKIWYLDMLLKKTFQKHSYNYIVIKENDIIIKSLNYLDTFIILDTF